MLRKMNLSEVADTAAVHHVEMLIYGRTVLVQDAAYLCATAQLQKNAIFNYPPFDGTNKVLLALHFAQGYTSDDTSDMRRLNSVALVRTILEY